MAGRRKYFHVADSVADEPWSNDELAALIRLMGKMNTRWARNNLTPEQAATIRLGPTEIMAISGKRRPDVALTSLERLADVASMSVRRDGHVVEINWPNFAEFQGYEGRARPQRGHSVSASASASVSASEEKTRAPSAPGADAPPRGPRRELVEKPENFPDDSRERIKAWGDSKGFGRDLLNAGLERFREWEPQKPPYRRTFKQWEGSFKKIVREGVAAGMIGKPEGKAKPAYHRDDSGQVLVPNEWRGLAG